MSSDTWPLWGIVIDLVLIIINAYFAAARRAFTSANKTRIRESADDGNMKAARLNSILSDPWKKYKLSIRAFNIIIYMLFCLVSVSCFFMPLRSAFTDLVSGSTVSGIIAFLISFFIPAVFLMALGEVFPRRIAVQHAEQVALSTVNLVRILMVIMKPLSAVTAFIAFLFLKLFRQRTDVNDNVYSEDNIVEMLEAGQESGELKEEGKKMITGVFAFDDILAYEIMTPRTDVFAIDINDSSDQYIDELMELRYSRIPVYEDDSDNIIGILYIKDYLIKAREDGFDNVDIRSILRKPYFVPETKNIDSLFVELQKTKQHIAILIDEYGGFCGIVTMEDIIEEVMGDIDDEYDLEEEEIKKIGDDLYLIEGSTDIDDVNEELNLHIESDDSETIGGFIIDMFGEIPGEKDIGREVFHENLVFTIKSVQDRRIKELALKITENTAGEEINE